MAVIYDISTGNIVKENTGVTRLDEYAGLPECNTELQPVHTDATSEETNPCDAYMSVIRELLREL
ncbi:MAG TPA: hypothetical protein DDW55_03920 [Gammaproteobacteria bacterium]|nr:hypothetical protein [Gammaproteobacteria bacterium]